MYIYIYIYAHTVSIVSQRCTNLLSANANCYGAHHRLNKLLEINNKYLCLLLVSVVCFDF